MAGFPKSTDAQLRRQLLTLGLFPLSEQIAWSSIFPYIHAMVRSVSQSSDPEGQKTAFFASLLVSVFTFGEFLMAPQWARVSDRIGRKSTLLIGSLGAMFSATTFGLSSSLPMAIVSRSFAGMLNPNLGVIDTYIGEIASKGQQARGFSTIAFMRGLGYVTGPIVGGYLSEPSKQMPSIFHGIPIWEKYPYLLPNLVVVVCLATSCMLGLTFLRESHPEFWHREDIARRLWKRVQNLLCSKTVQDGQGSYALVVPGQELDVDEEVMTDKPEAGRLVIDRRKAFSKQIIMQILCGTCIGFVAIANLALVPIFLGTEQPSTASSIQRSLGGGFGFSTENISHVLLSQAIVSLTYQLFVIPRVIKEVGVLRTYRCALLLWTAIYTAWPFTVLLPGVFSILAYVCILWMHSLCTGLIFTCTPMMITNNAPDPIYLATINGVATSASCLARTAGPITVGALFQVGLQRGNVGLSFWALATVTLLALMLSWTLKEHKDEEEGVMSA